MPACVPRLALVALLLMGAAPVTVEARPRARYHNRVPHRRWQRARQARLRLPGRFRRPRQLRARPLERRRSERRARRPDRSISALRRMVRLARDPAHNNKITTTSKREAIVGVALERAGRLPGPIRREKSGRSEFVDAAGRRWDVKAFRSDFAPAQGGFVLERALRKLRKQFTGGEGVILDTTHLRGDHLRSLRRAIARRGWDKNVLWYPQDARHGANASIR